jgi:GNAT superfamily N-acetyltransferase
MTTDARLRPGEPKDAPVCAAILNDWIDRTEWMPRCHPPDDVERYFREEVLPNRTVVMADRTAPCGFIAIDMGDRLVTALYLAPEARGQGVGKALVDYAKALLSDHVSLWTFLANARARAFYAREGFREVRRTEGDNEEGLPDVLLRWRPDPPEHPHA